MDCLRLRSMPDYLENIPSKAIKQGEEVKRRIVIWGTGYEAGMLLDSLKKLYSWSDDIVAFCDNNGEKNEFRGYKVIRPDSLRNMDIDYLVIATMYYKDILRQIKSELPSLESFVVNRMMYESFVRAEDQYNKRCAKPIPAGICSDENITVYTALFDKYDSLVDPSYVSENIRYVCFTDDKDLRSDIWDIRVIDNDMDGIYKARHIKMFPDRYLESAGMSIWVDAKYSIIGDLLDYCKIYWRGEGMLCFPHFKWDSMSDELAFLIGYRPKWKKEYILQASDYLRDGMPDDFDTFDTGCIVRQSGNTHIDEIMRLWWDQLIKYNNPRDQIPFRYALWKSGFKPDISNLYIEYNPFIRVSRVVD